MKKDTIQFAKTTIWGHLFIFILVLSCILPWFSRGRHNYVEICVSSLIPFIFSRWCFLTAKELISRYQDNFPFWKKIIFWLYLLCFIIGGIFGVGILHHIVFDGRGPHW